MTCHSGGTLEIYVEPHLPAAQLWVVGTTPIAGALARLGSAAGWRVTRHRPDRRGRRLPGRRPGPGLGRHPRPRPRGVAVRRRRDPGDLGRGGGRAGADPRGLLRRARRLADAGRRRARLAARGDDHRRTSGSPRSAPRPGSTSAPRRPRRSRCRSSPSWSRSAAAARTSSPRPVRRRSPAGIPATVTLEPVVDDIVLLDPVCGMTVERATARHLAEHDGVIYAFCSIGCRTRFIKEPATYLSANAPSAMTD